MRGAKCTIHQSSNKALSVHVYPDRLTMRPEKRKLLNIEHGIKIALSIRKREQRNALYPFLALYMGESFYIKDGDLTIRQLTILKTTITRFNRECDGFFYLVLHYYNTTEYPKRNQVEWYEVARLL